MAFGLPSATSVFIPDHEGTAGLVTGFSRKPETFKIGQWATYTPMRKPVAYYLELNFDQCARMLGTRSGNYTGGFTIWPRGQDAPQLATGLEEFQWVQVKTNRHAEGYTLDRDTEQDAEWGIAPWQNSIIAQRTMTERTLVTIDRATNTSNYATNHTSTVNALAGGYINAGTSTNPIFKIALQAMFLRIFADTRGCVRQEDMVVVLNPAVAYAISQSAEITDFVKNNQFGLPQLQGELLTNWGLPERYQGFRIVVEDAIYVPTAPNASGVDADPLPTTTGYGAWPYGTVAMLSRPGGLVSEAGGPSFSTVHVFLREDMTMESRDDPNNRKTETRIVNDYNAYAVAPVTGYLLTSVLQNAPLLGAFSKDDMFSREDSGRVLKNEVKWIETKPEVTADENAGKLVEAQKKIWLLEQQRQADYAHWQEQFKQLQSTTTAAVTPPGWEAERNQMRADLDAMRLQLEALKSNGGKKKE